MYSFKLAFANSVKLLKPFHDLELLKSQDHLFSVPFFRWANCSSQKVSCPRTLRSLASELKFLPQGLSNLGLFLWGRWHLTTSPRALCSSEKPQSLRQACCGYFWLRQTILFISSDGGFWNNSFLWHSHIFMRQYLLHLWLNPLAIQTQLPFQKHHASKTTHLAAQWFWAKPERSTPSSK